ncbi:peptidyl-prolyl cis-trans isomerase PASTICCINO1 [Quercus suber]|uniref:peptidyl-prolyl cis-trans isomerase PASTICCINO1 n=1 Tax=Quercus suber TaxID=58331 RepID=UPI0032DE818D
MAMAVDEDAEQEVTPQNKKSPTEDEKRRKKIVPGSLMKALIRPGGGDQGLKMVIRSCIIAPFEHWMELLLNLLDQKMKLLAGNIYFYMTGRGTPIRHVLGKSKMIVGLLEGIPTLLKGEVAMFKMKPQVHYGEDDCPVSVVNEFLKDDELHFEIEMIDFFKAKVVSDDLGAVKKVPKGLEMGIGTMARGEKAVAYVTRQYLTQSPLIPVIVKF